MLVELAEREQVVCLEVESAHAFKLEGGQSEVGDGREADRRGGGGPARGGPRLGAHNLVGRRVGLGEVARGKDDRLFVEELRAEFQERQQRQGFQRLHRQEESHVAADGNVEHVKHLAPVQVLGLLGRHAAKHHVLAAVQEVAADAQAQQKRQTLSDCPRSDKPLSTGACTCAFASSTDHLTSDRYSSLTFCILQCEGASG